MQIFTLLSIHEIIQFEIQSIGEILNEGSPIITTSS